MSPKSTIMIALVILGVIFIIVFRKEILKLGLTLALLVVGICALNIYYPEKVKVIGGYVQNVKELKELAENNQYVKLDFKDGSKTEIEDVKLKVGDKWYAFNDIKDTIKVKDGVYTITVQGQRVTIDKDEVVKAIDMLQGLK